MVETSGTLASLYLENAAGGDVFTKLGNLKRITPAGVTRAEIDVTDLDDQINQYRPGTADLGQIQGVVSLEVGNSVQEAIITEIEAGTVSDGKDIAFYHATDNQHVVYSGFFVSFVPSENGVNEERTATFTYRVNSVVSGPTSGAPATS